MGSNPFGRFATAYFSLPFAGWLPIRRTSCLPAASVRGARRLRPAGQGGGKASEQPPGPLETDAP